MKVLITEVDSCESCPKFYWGAPVGKYMGLYAFCSELEKEIVTPKSEIPDWCPLPNSEEGR